MINKLVNIAAVTLVLFPISQALANGGAFFGDDGSAVGFGPDGVTPAAQSQGSVYFGDVRDLSGKGVADATVTIEDKNMHNVIYQVRTGANGHYQTGELNVDPTATNVLATKPDYALSRTLSLSKTLARNQPVETDFIVAPAKAS